MPKLYKCSKCGEDELYAVMLVDGKKYCTKCFDKNFNKIAEHWV